MLQLWSIGQYEDLCISFNDHLMWELLGQLFRELHSMIVCESTRPVTNCKSHHHISVITLLPQTVHVSGYVNKEENLFVNI